MKIEYIKGNAFDTEAPYILHGCNAQGAMGSGFAAAVKAIYPQCVDAYKERHATSPLKLGEVIEVDCGPHIMLNGITQEFYGRDPDVVYVSYEAVADVIREVNHIVKQRGIHQVTSIVRVAMPKIGAGLANGEWSIIEQLIEAGSENFQPVVYVID